MRQISRIAAVIALTLIACASTGYQAASLAYEQDSRDYAKAREDVNKAHTQGRTTAEQWLRWQTIRADVQAADTAYYTDLTQWRDTGTKPPTYDSYLASLRAAQLRMIALAMEVR